MDRELDTGLVSIHAPARGATGHDAPPVSLRLCFNPRAREGRDAGFRLSVLMETVSIHAPARGATAAMSACHESPAFQSTRPRGARHPSCVIRYNLASFNPRAREGRDNLSIKIARKLPRFNPRAREGRDLI